MNSMTFLGTGGGRYVVFRQARASGGIYFDILGKRFVLDPGPGSLVHMRRLKLKNPHGILVSHMHIDHCSDANILLDGIENPFLIAERHCLEGLEKEVACISLYEQSRAGFSRGVEPGDVVEIPESEIKITATMAKHNTPTVGFLIDFGKKIGYVSDGYYYSGQEKQFEGCSIIIFNITVPSGKKPLEKKHMSVENAVKFLNRMKNKPELAIMTHVSFWMMRNSVNAQRKIIEDMTGVKTIVARDFSSIEIDRMKTLKSGLENFV